MNHLKNFQLFEKKFNPNVGDLVTITYFLTGEPVPVKIKEVLRGNNGYIVSFDVEAPGSMRGAPDAKIYSSDIISPYKSIRSPVGSGFVSNNTNMGNFNSRQPSNDIYL